jgi:hypothetical protein
VLSKRLRRPRDLETILVEPRDSELHTACQSIYKAPYGGPVHSLPFLSLAYHMETPSQCIPTEAKESRAKPFSGTNTGSVFEETDVSGLTSGLKRQQQSKPKLPVSLTVPP